MYISEIDLHTESDVVRAEAQITWEEVDRSPITLFFEVDAGFQDAFWADPNGFLLAAILPAWHAGEKRLKIDGSLCPVLCNNLESAMRMFDSWYPELGPRPTIEPSQGFEAVRPSEVPQTASFLSCGIDSLSTLRWDKLNLPPDHPAAIKAVLPICFTDVPGMATEHVSGRVQKLITSASRVAADAGIHSIPVKTNIMKLDDDGWFHTQKWLDAMLTTPGYFLSRRFSRFYIAPSSTSPHLGSSGTNPLLSSWYSSGHVHVQHHGVITMSRFERTALVADWPVGLQNILVCTQSKQSFEIKNCGKCEKCIRTMMALEALGKLKESPAFPIDEVTPELLYTLEEYNMRYSFWYHRSLVPLLKERGRHDLVEAIEHLSELRDQNKPEPELTAEDIAELVPRGNSVILPDERRSGHGNIVGRRALRWGPPIGNKEAMHQFETLRQAGGKFVVFRKSVLWWLNYYPELNRHLREQFTCIAENDRFVVFDLQEQSRTPDPQGAAS
ncbi:hypothetical protein ACFL6S_16475 [Candidatus Poribacteria bacterium]